MKFGEPWWLFGIGIALAVAVLLVLEGVLLLRNVRRFGDEARVYALLTGRAGHRRAFKGVLLVVAVGFAFVAAAQPKYGRSTRRIPATNLDVAIVLDYSKSMYARDVTPSRIERAKSEVRRLIDDLPGARFAAVAFAGDPLTFPLTSDGAAIAQFFQQMVPNDMPVGGTAIARALEAARMTLERDPKSADHRRVILLVTDGEDLEGDPVGVAKAVAQNETTIHVVQIGGRTPEPIPEVGPGGEIQGWRKDEQGQPLTTALSSEGEATLANLAQLTGGSIVRSEKGSTGITEIAQRLKRMMTEELSEKVETVYADVFHYPLGLAILLLLIETFVGQVPRPSLLGGPRRLSWPWRSPSSAGSPKLSPRQDSRTRAARAARARKAVGKGARKEAASTSRKPRSSGPERGRRSGVARSALVVLGMGCAAALGMGGLTACERTDALFQRQSPTVDEALSLLDAGDAGAAVDLLQKYLETGSCEKGGGPNERARQQHNAAFDLGLGLFSLAETFGRRFGEEEVDAGPAPSEEDLAKRTAEIECALRIVRAVAADSEIPVELRARAAYLAGNLEFLRRDYQSAVAEYDRALRLIPGLPEDAGDGVGRDAAYNRAIALKRLEEQPKPDAGPDASSDAGPDAEPPDAGPPDAGPPDAGPPDAGDEDAGSDRGNGEPDTGAEDRPDAGEGQDGGGEQGQDGGGPDDSGSEPSPEEQPDAAPPPPEEQPPSESSSQDERVLDLLERAPTLEQEHAKQRALRLRGRRGMEDK